MRLTPEAGGIKTDQFRDVPIHDHLLERGFIEFVQAAKDDYLFCNVARDGSIEGPASGIYRRITGLVRGVVVDPNVQPNHAWRYTFKAIGTETGIEEIVLDAICGHAAQTQGRKYSRVTLKKKFEAMRKFPRYL